MPVTFCLHEEHLSNTDSFASVLLRIDRCLRKNDPNPYKIACRHLWQSFRKKTVLMTKKL